jgi:tripartite-type tricarboxylate transporter receptor subunit TctC
MTQHRRVTAFVATTLVLGVAAAATGEGAAVNWPTRPIRAIVPIGAGSATDIVPRSLFEEMSPELGQPIVVENRVGAGGTLGVAAVARAIPDGYTMLVQSSALAIAPWIIPNAGYNVVRDLSGVLMIGQSANVMIAPPSRGWKTIQDFVAAARARAGSINYGSAGIGTATHLSAEKFRLAAAFQAVHIPYKGGAEALADILGGRIDFYFCPISTALPLIRDGRVTALAVSTPKRAADLPEVPTTIEAGYPNSDSAVWYGAFVPSRTPRDIVEKFHDVGTRVLATPAMQGKLKTLAVDPMPFAAAEMDRFVAEEVASNGKLIRAAGIK